MKQRTASNFDEIDDSEPPLSAASAAGIFAEGSRFGTYVIGPCIGHGGMARIYRAEHEGLRRQVALKVLTIGVAEGTEGRARFLREARIAAAIKHPNVVNIFDVGIENRVPYLVMELLVGQDLDALLRSTGALSESTIIDMVIPVVAGLVAVHDAGVVHRDLKPGNIFLSKGPNDEIEPKLLDFGISKANGTDKLKLTSVTRELLMGTPLYMSPEALLGEEMTALSDQYSLGVVLYECCTGINPFIADSVAETARRVTSGEYPPLSEQPIRPSKRLASIIERAMSLEPAERYPDMRAMGRDLLGLAGQRTRITWGLTFDQVASAARVSHVLALQPPAPASPAGGSRNTRPGSDPWRWAALGAFAALTATVLSWTLSRHPTAPVALPAEAVPETRIHRLEPTAATPEPSRAAASSTTAASEADRAALAGAPALYASEPGSAESSETRAQSHAAARLDEPDSVEPRPRRARRAPRSVAEPAGPEWAPRTVQRTGAARRVSANPRGPNGVELGTNSAPIFE